MSLLATLQSFVLQHRDCADLVALLAAVACYAAAFARRRQPHLAILGIVAGGFIISFAMAMDPFLHPWDERFHAVVAKHLMTDPFTPTLYNDPALAKSLNWTHTYVWLHKPPLSLWLIAASLRIFGVSTLAVRLPSIVLLGAAVWATFRLGSYWFSPRVGLLAAFLHSLNGQLIGLASGRESTDHPDSIFSSLIAIGVLIAVVQLRRGGLGLAFAVGAVTGLAILTKWLPGLIILGLWLVGLHRQSRPLRVKVTNIALALLACTMVVAPWQIHILRAFPAQAAFESAYNRRHIWEALEGHDGSLFFHVASVPRLYGWLALLPMGWFSRTYARRRGDPNAQLVVLWFAVPYIFFSFVATKMVSYAMISAPAVFIMISVGIKRLRECAIQQTRPLWQRRLALGLALLLVALPVRSTLRHWRPFHESHADQQVAHDPVGSMFFAP